MSLQQTLTILYTTIKKDIQRLLSSQFNAGLLILGPLLLIGLVGFAFQDNSLNDVTIGVSGDTASFADVEQRIQAEGYTVRHYDNNQACISDNKDGQTGACLIFTDTSPTTIRVYVDFSRSQFAAAVLNEVNNVFDRVRREQLNDFAASISSGATDLSGELSTFQDRLINVRSSLNQTQTSISSASGEQDRIERLQRHTKNMSDWLNETQSYLGRVDEDIQSTKERLENQRGVASTLLDQQGCANDYPVLAERSEAEQRSILNEADNPACVIIWNQAQYFDQQQDTLDSIQSGLQGQEQRIVSATNRLDNITNQDVSASRTEEIQSVVTSTLEQVEQSTADLQGLTNTGFLSTLQSAETGVNPFDIDVQRHDDLSNVSILDILFPGILITLISFVGILIGTVLVMKERTSNAGFRNAISPTKTWVLRLATTITGAGLSAMQGSIVFLVAYALFGLNTVFSPVLIGFFIGLGAVFTIIGQVIGTFSPNEEVGTLLSIITAVVFLIFSSLITPLEKMTPWLSTLLTYTPFNQGMRILRRQLLFDESLFSLPLSLSVLTACFVVCAIIVYATDERSL